MKRIFVLVAVALFSANLFADEAVLIDFTKLAADISVDGKEGDGPNQNRATVMDYSNTRIGTSFTEDQKKAMKTSLAIGNWRVVLNSSAKSVTNDQLSFAQETASKQWEKVLGVRVHFPEWNHNASARILPPFEIPAFEPQAEVSDDGTIAEPDGNGITGPSRFENGFGVVKNVGTIKSVAINVYGLNFPHGVSALIIDNEGHEKKMFMGYVEFDGWAELTWNNPQYVQEVRNRSLRLYPIYPDSTPFIKFGGFELSRDADRNGGDFVVYFKDVKIIYDKAVLDTERDIDDEATWSIITTRETARKRFEMERFGQDQVLRYVDRQKQATETEFTPTGAGEQQ